MDAVFEILHNQCVDMQGVEGAVTGSLLQHAEQPVLRAFQQLHGQRRQGILCPCPARCSPALSPAGDACWLCGHHQVSLLTALVYPHSPRLVKFLQSCSQVLGTCERIACLCHRLLEAPVGSDGGTISP